MRFLTDLRLLLIALWLGAACFFSFAVAPSAFGVLPSRELAGSMVNRTLLIVNISGIVIGAIAILLSFAGAKGENKIKVWSERFILLIMTAACAVGQIFIGFWISSVKAQMGKPIDEVPLEDPLRIQFNQLHEYSVWILVTAMIAALDRVFYNRTKNGCEGCRNKKRPV